MRRLRSRMGLGSWSALFALTIQLVLSFGHLHFDGISPRFTLAPLALRWAVQPPATLLDVPAAPTKHKPASLADDFCAICSVMRFAGVPAAAPVLPLPIRGAGILLDVSVGFVLATSPHLLFRARAPPHA